MKLFFLFASLFYFSTGYTQKCPSHGSSIIKNYAIGCYIPTNGVLWNTGLTSDRGVEYPQRTNADYAAGVKPKLMYYAGGLWMSSVTNSKLAYSSSAYSNHFAPGVIKLSTGKRDSINCSFYDKVWNISKSVINAHISKWYQSTIFPLTGIDSSIVKWPAKGNRYYAHIGIDDYLAPFEDVNSNGIYDPEYGDFPKIKGDNASFTVFNDYDYKRGDSFIGVEVHLMTYNFENLFIPYLYNSIFYDCEIVKKTSGNADQFHFQWLKTRRFNFSFEKERPKIDRSFSPELLY